MCPFVHALTATAEDAGTLLPGQSADVFERIPGFVDKVLVTPGSAVKKGDVLIEVKSIEAAARAAQAAASADRPWREGPSRKRFDNALIHSGSLK
jgi:multidrug efflux pump subunit AcrA (membrane-fusion protein)